MQRITLQSVDSTMAAMERLLKYSSLPEGSVVTAAYQYQGRGMEENIWESEPGVNVLATFVLFPRFLHPSRQFLLNCCVSLAVRELVSEQIPALEVKIKWPNDIYIQDRKASGLLIRHEIQGDQFNISLIGIGLNVNQQVFRTPAPNPISLIQIDGLYRNVSVMVEKLQSKLMQHYLALKEGEGEELFTRYHDHLYQIGKEADYVIFDKPVKAEILGVDEYGHLLLLTAQGEELSCDTKEIVFL